MTVPPWEFFDRVVGRQVLGDDVDTGKLRSAAGAVQYRVWGSDGEASLVSLLDLAADSDCSISAAVASLRVLADLGQLAWRDDGVAFCNGQRVGDQL
jgi:hypothetical protein